MDLVIGVDIGTAQLKVGVFDTQGRCQAWAARPCAPDYQAGGRVTLAPELWWDAFADAFAECRQAVDRSAIRAIGVSSQAQTYILVDQAGQPLGPAVSWLDTTGDADGAAAALGLDAEKYYAHAGFGCPCPMQAACKLRRQAETATPWAGAKQLLFADGALMFRLTGEAGVSRNLAAMSGLYSLKLNDWWPAGHAAARLPRALLPRLCEMGEPIGQLRPDVAQDLNIPVAPVVAGANDQTAAAIGTGLAEPGETMLGMGTAMVAYQVIRASAPALKSRPLRGIYPRGFHWQLVLCSTAGAVLEWAKNILTPDHTWDEFFAEALAAEPGSAGLRLDPNWDHPNSGGSLLGIRLAHERDHVLRAVLEGIACAAREMLDQLNASGTVRATGGASGNDKWMQMLADFTGRSLERLHQPHAGLWGTAIMAGYGAGLFDDILETARSRRPSGQVFTPRRKCSRTYDRVYRNYLATRPG